MTKLIAIDPGEMTGYAMAEWDRDTNEYTVVKWDHAPWKQFLIRYAQNFEWDVVVYEAWRLRHEEAPKLVGSDMQSSQCLGGIRLQAWLHEAVLIEQSTQIKPFIDKRMGGTEYLPGRGGVEHHRDALRHLHYYLTIKKEGTWVNPRVTGSESKR